MSVLIRSFLMILIFFGSGAACKRSELDSTAQSGPVQSSIKGAVKDAIKKYLWGEFKPVLDNLAGTNVSVCLEMLVGTVLECKSAATLVDNVNLQCATKQGDDQDNCIYELIKVANGTGVFQGCVDGARAGWGLKECEQNFEEIAKYGPGFLRGTALGTPTCAGGISDTSWATIYDRMCTGKQAVDPCGVACKQVILNDAVCVQQCTNECRGRFPNLTAGQTVEEACKRHAAAPSLAGQAVDTAVTGTLAYVGGTDQPGSSSSWNRADGGGFAAAEACNNTSIAYSKTDNGRDEYCNDQRSGFNNDAISFCSSKCQSGSVNACVQGCYDSFHDFCVGVWNCESGYKRRP